MAMTTDNMEQLIRSELWSTEIKEILRDELMASRYVRTLDGFPDGDTFTIPSIGQAQVDDYEENTEIEFRPLDTGEFQFSITEYLASGHYITDKAKQDSFYAAQLIAKFVPEQARALMVRYETDVLKQAEVGIAANSNNVIDNLEMRWAAGATGAKMQVEDFARANYVLTKQNVPDRNRVAIVDPSVAYTMNTLTNLTNVSDNPHWEGIVSDGIATGMKFVKNIYGFDVYTSNYLPTVTDGALNTAADAAVDFSSTNGKANLFFSADSTVTPFVGAWREQPTVEFERQGTRKRDAYWTTARYGVKLYRPENMVVVPSKTDV